jgi:hypothetical protein
MADAVDVRRMPPPMAVESQFGAVEVVDRVTLLPLTALSSMVTRPSLLIPAPPAKTHGELVVILTVLPLTLLLRSASVATSVVSMPPPKDRSANGSGFT